MANIESLNSGRLSNDLDKAPELQKSLENGSGSLKNGKQVLAVDASLVLPGQEVGEQESVDEWAGHSDDTTERLSRNAESGVDFSVNRLDLSDHLNIDFALSSTQDNTRLNCIIERDQETHKGSCDQVKKILVDQDGMFFEAKNFGVDNAAEHIQSCEAPPAHKNGNYDEERTPSKAKTSGTIKCEEQTEQGTLNISNQLITLLQSTSLSNIQTNFNADGGTVDKKSVDKDREEKDKDQFVSCLPLMITKFRLCKSFPNIEENGETENEISLHYQRMSSAFRLSLRLSPYLPVCINIPNADDHTHVEKAGYLQRLSGRGFPYLHQWRRRFCVLSNGCLFLYEKENSRGTEKSVHVVDLKYFDCVTAAQHKDSKKASNVFVVTSQDRSFFDPGRHLFAADTLTEMHDWITRLRESIELIRNNNRPTKQSAAKERDLKALLKQSTQQSKEGQGEQQNSKHGTQHAVQSQGQLPHAMQSGQKKQDKTKKRDSDAEDEVDAKALGAEKKEDFTLSLEQKIKPEADGQQGLPTKEAGGIHVREEKGVSPCAASPSSLSSAGDGNLKKSSSAKITLQSPAFNLEAKPQLESITKTRIRGPAGRRAPQSRRTMLVKQRASSMSALQADGNEEDTSRSGVVDGMGPDICEDTSCQKESCTSLNGSHPVLAYHYSSDEEESPDEGHMGSDRSLGTSAAQPSADYLWKSTSFNIREVPHYPVKGLRVCFSQEESQIESPPTIGDRQPCSLQKSPSKIEAEELLEFRSLPRSLSRGTKGRILKDKSKRNDAIGSSGRNHCGRTSPEMDALDNLLMKRTVRHSPPVTTNDQEESDGSTFKAHENDNAADHDNARVAELADALGRLSAALSHLQTHTAQLESRTKLMEAEFRTSVNDVVSLQEATEQIRQDVKRLSDNAALVAQEAVKAKRDLVLQRQETEKLQRETSDVLSEARKSQKEFEAAKTRYESTTKELHSLMVSVRASLTAKNVNSNQSNTKVTLAEAGKSLSENDKSKIVLDEGKENGDKKVPCKDIGSQKGGYQSFFHRPSSLIYGLTSRSANKSFNRKGKEEIDGSKKDGKEKEKKQARSTEKEKEITNKPKQRQSDIFECIDVEKNKEKGNFGELFDHRQNKQGVAIDRKPLKDEPNTDEKLNAPVAVSHISISVNESSQPFLFEKSLSSTKAVSTFTKLSRSTALCLSPEESNKSQSNTSSPESPVSPTGSIFSPPPLPLPPTTKLTPEMSFSSSVTRQTSMSTVPEDALLTSTEISHKHSETGLARSRPGVFAIVRQKSSPNIPVQRQNSTTLFPLQRQLSLGTVPEEGQLPHRESLMSVPEDRPIVDRTLSLSPSASLVSFPLSPSASGDRMDVVREEASLRNSMEIATGPVMSGSRFQEFHARQLPPASEFECHERPLATSSLRKRRNRKKMSSGVVV